MVIFFLHSKKISHNLVFLLLAFTIKVFKCAVFAWGKLTYTLDQRGNRSLVNHFKIPRIQSTPWKFTNHRSNQNKLPLTNMNLLNHIQLPKDRGIFFQNRPFLQQIKANMIIPSRPIFRKVWLMLLQSVYNSRKPCIIFLLLQTKLILLNMVKKLLPIARLG